MHDEHVGFNRLGLSWRIDADGGSCSRRRLPDRDPNDQGDDQQPSNSEHLPVDATRHSPLCIGRQPPGLVLQNGAKRAEDRPVAEQQKSPFDRVSNGYDPRQVAAFAAEALAWKRELAQTRSALDSARKKLDRYESVIGSVETVEREAAELVEDAERRAAEIIEQAEDEAAKILEMARDQVGQSAEQTSSDSPPQDGDLWLTPEPSELETPDPVETIFEPVEEVEVLDPEAERERRVAAAAANLWKRRGVIAPSE